LDDGQEELAALDAGIAALEDRYAAENLTSTPTLRRNDSSYRSSSAVGIAFLPRITGAFRRKVGVDVKSN